MAANNLVDDDLEEIEAAKIVIPKKWKFLERDGCAYVFISKEAYNLPEQLFGIENKDVAHVDRILICATPISKKDTNMSQILKERLFANYLQKEKEYVDENDYKILSFNGLNGKGNYFVITDKRWKMVSNVSLTDGSIGYPTLFKCYYTTDKVIIDINVLAYCSASPTITRAFFMLKNI